MADPVLHIKDGYFFEVPKALWKVEYTDLEQVPLFLRSETNGHHETASLILDAKADPAVKQSKAYQDLLHEYNHSLSGKILIPQPFGELKNLHDAKSGFAISKFMILELVVAAILFLIFTQYAKRVQNGQLPKGRFWNLIDTFLLFIRDEIVRPSIGGGHEEHAEHASTDTHGHEAHAPHVHAHVHRNPADRFLPFVWTMFFFILGMNLLGMIPWVGAPTGAFGVTLALAGAVLLVSVGSGVQVFGPAGFVLNQAPDLGILPLNPLSPLLFIVKIGLLIIELAGLLIKHGVLAIRLLANIMAGHLVLLGIMGIAVAAASSITWQWSIAAVIVVVGSTLLSVLELFVCFLQAYVFCFLASLFIGAAIHKH